MTQIQLDTYHRELERFGGAEGLARVEALWAADSQLVLDLLETPELADGLPRSSVLATSMNELLSDLGLDLEERAKVFTALKDEAVRDGTLAADSEAQRSQTFRAERATFDEWHQGKLTALLEARSQRIRPLAAALPAEARAALGKSLVHLNAFRLTPGPDHTMECLAYDFLARHLSSKAGRARRQSEAPRG